MNKTRLVSAAALSVAFLVLTGMRAAETLPAGTPTFTKDVAPILYKNCASCHRPGDIAPMSLLTYENARPWAKAIREQVASGQMPPWHATEPRGIFSNDRRLSDEEKDTLIRWVNGGAPQGDPKALPPPPKFPEGWEIGTPDAIISMPTPYQVPASGTIAYQIIEVPTNFTEDKWVQAIEIKPGNRNVVHHVLVFCREPDAAPRPTGYTQVVPSLPAATPRPAQSNAPQMPNPGALIATTAPGTNAMTFEPGVALRVKAGSVFTFQMHYTVNGEAASDRTSVGLIFAKQPPQQEMRASAFANPLLVLPPGSRDQAVDAVIQFNENVHIQALFPHTHLRGKSWSYRLVYPDGRAEVVLSVPKYDFNWQTYYVFTKPLAVPKGTRLEATARYDNSVANIWNPDPQATVRWGAQTWEEMQYSGINYTIDDQRLPSPTRGAGDERK